MPREQFLISSTNYNRRLVHGFEKGIRLSQFFIYEPKTNLSLKRVEIPVLLEFECKKLGYSITAPLLYSKEFCNGVEEIKTIDDVQTIFKSGICFVEPNLQAGYGLTITTIKEPDSIVEEQPHLKYLVSKLKEAMTLADKDNMLLLISRSMMGIENLSSGIDVGIAFNINRQVRDKTINYLTEDIHGNEVRDNTINHLTEEIKNKEKAYD